MASEWTQRERRLLAVVVVSAIVFVGDVVTLNVVGEVSAGWWVLAVPVGLLVVPLVGIVGLASLLMARRRR